MKRILFVLLFLTIFLFPVEVFGAGCLDVNGVCVDIDLPGCDPCDSIEDTSDAIGCLDSSGICRTEGTYSGCQKCVPRGTTSIPQPPPATSNDDEQLRSDLNDGDEWLSQGCLINGVCQETSDPNCETPCTVFTGDPNPPRPETGIKIGELKKAALSLNPLEISSPADLLPRAINVLFAFIGSIALILYIYAGFLWMSASGNSDKINKAKKIIIWTALGILAMASSYLILRIILEKIG